MPLVQAILIDPFACSISEIEVDGGNHRSYYPLLSHETAEVTCFSVAYPGVLVGGDALFVDDEGLMKEPERFFLVGGTQPFAGKGLIIGADAEGNAAPARTPKFFLDLTVRFVRFEGSRLVYTTTPWQPGQQ